MTKTEFKTEFARLLPDVSAADADSMAEYWWNEGVDSAEVAAEYERKSWAE